MVKFRKRIELAVAMMLMISEGKGNLVSTSDMGEVISRSYQVRIVKNLLKAKLIKAREGRKGGYILAREAGSISIKDIFDAINDNTVFKSRTLQDIYKDIDAVLKKFTL